ncbi:MAG TPA: carboxypeptidase regulatory-like domain-containing protein [Burkholderiales bacterium]|nr:carboxypeptidase regulatory-like domain-containing protein [Burkholderiales bacterium]
MIVGRVGVLCAVAMLAQAWVVESRAQPAVQQQGPVSYISGGIGLEERQAMQGSTTDFNLKVQNAIPGRPYVSDTTVSIVDAGGNEVLKTTLDGPWLMAKLPAGRYTVRASDGTRTQTQSIQLTERGMRDLMFRWTDNPVMSPAASRPAGSGATGSSTP